MEEKVFLNSQIITEQKVPQESLIPIEGYLRVQGMPEHAQSIHIIPTPVPGSFKKMGYVAVLEDPNGEPVKGIYTGWGLTIPEAINGVLALRIMPKEPTGDNVACNGNTPVNVKPVKICF